MALHAISHVMNWLYWGYNHVRYDWFPLQQHWLSY